MDCIYNSLFSLFAFFHGPLRHWLKIVQISVPAKVFHIQTSTMQC